MAVCCKPKQDVSSGVEDAVAKGHQAEYVKRWRSRSGVARSFATTFCPALAETQNEGIELPQNRSPPSPRVAVKMFLSSGILGWVLRLVTSRSEACASSAAD